MDSDNRRYLELVLAHDVNKIVAAGALRAELALRSGSQHRMKQCLADCIQVLHDISSLVGQTQSDEVSARTCVTSAVSLVQSSFAEVQFSVVGDAVVLVPRATFLALILNLLDNAARYRAKNVTISIGTSQHGGVAIEVEDDGPGLPSHRLSQPFDCSTGPTEGMGVGLWLVERHAKACGGSIVFEPSKRKGSRFVISFPPSEVKREAA